MNNTTETFKIPIEVSVFTVRSLFYLIKPAETFYEYVDQVPDLLEMVKPFFKF